MSVDLSSLLSKPASEVVPPKPLPNGLYVFRVVDYEARKDVGEKKNTVLDFDLEMVQAIDVDPSECELPKKLRQTFWLTEAALFRLKDFLETTLAIEGGQRTLFEMLPEAKNRMGRAEVVQQTYVPKGKTEPQTVNNINNLFPLE